MVNPSAEEQPRLAILGPCNDLAHHAQVLAFAVNGFLQLAFNVFPAAFADAFNVQFELGYF